MPKRFLIMLFLLSTVTLSVITVATVACSSSPSTISSNSSGSSSANTATGNVVHMGDMKFLQSNITIHKGQSITLTDDSAVPHTIANGTWDASTPKAAREQGAPEVNDVNISGNNSQAIGPFTTAGTFHLYCTIHPGMNLTVIVH